MALFVDVKVAVASLVIPNLVMDGIQLRRQGPVGDTPRRLAPLLVFTMLGTVVGTKLLVALSGRAVTLILGAFVVAFVLFDLVRFSPRVDRRWERMLAAPVGLVAGIMGGITNAPGTPLAVYFIALGMDKREFVRSVAFSFLIVKAVQLATLAWYGLLSGAIVLAPVRTSFFFSPPGPTADGVQPARTTRGKIISAVRIETLGARCEENRMTS